MSSGRGRGRGLNKDNQARQSPWNTTPKTSNDARQILGNVTRKDDTFKKKVNKMIDMQAKYADFIENVESSSSDEEIHDDEIMNKMTKGFTEELLNGKYVNKIKHQVILITFLQKYVLYLNLTLSFTCCYLLF